MIHGRRVDGWFVSSVVDVPRGLEANGSPNVKRSNSGQQVYDRHVCWLETACDDSTAFV